MADVSPASSVVHKTPEEYGDKFHDHLLEQYKLVRSRIVDVIDDRNSQNRFLLAVLSALLAAPALLLRSHQWGTPLPLVLAAIALFFPVLGAVISWHWAKWNVTFGQAIDAGYRELNAMEAYLPAQPFTVEPEYRREIGGGRHKTTTAFTILMSHIFFWGNNILATTIVVVALMDAC